jgi:hypothetical protein
MVYSRLVNVTRWPGLGTNKETLKTQPTLIGLCQQYRIYNYSTVQAASQVVGKQLKV